MNLLSFDNITQIKSNQIKSKLIVFHIPGSKDDWIYFTIWDRICRSMNMTSWIYDDRWLSPKIVAIEEVSYYQFPQ